MKRQSITQSIIQWGHDNPGLAKGIIFTYLGLVGIISFLVLTSPPSSPPQGSSKASTQQAGEENEDERVYLHLKDTSIRVDTRPGVLIQSIQVDDITFEPTSDWIVLKSRPKKVLIVMKFKGKTYTTTFTP